MSDICKKSFLYSIGAAAWIIIVASFMQKANDWFGTEDTIVSVIAVLILFSMSALIVGGLLVGKPVFLYIDGKKKEAILMIAANVGWMLGFFTVTLITLAIIK